MKAPKKGTTRIIKSQRVENCYAEMLGDKIIRLYWEEKLFELGQVVKFVKKDKGGQSNSNSIGWIVELNMPYESGKTDSVISVVFEEYGYLNCKTNEIEVI